MHLFETALEAALIITQNGGSTAAAEQSFSTILKGNKKGRVSTVMAKPRQENKRRKGGVAVSSRSIGSRT